VFKLFSIKSGTKKKNVPVEKSADKSQIHLTRKRQIIYGSLIIIGVFFATAGLRVLIGDVVEDAAARNEYDELRAYSPNMSVLPGESYDDETGQTADDDPVDSEVANENETIRALSFDELIDINGDFIGWINIGSVVDYPIVRGRDNNRYINTTFTGNRNSAGTIFMDYRNTDDFDEYVSILYGHLTRDGTMFSSLRHYLNPDYIRNNPDINITTRDGVNLTYKVFAAKITDAWDIAYSLSFFENDPADDVFPNVPGNAERFLLLSTCTGSPDDDERILVYAAISG